MRLRSLTSWSALGRILMMPLFALGMSAAEPLLQADFESPGTGFSTTAEGTVTMAPDEVISGAHALRLDSRAGGTEWHEILLSGEHLIPAHTTIEISFAYRWLAKPETGEKGVTLYALLRSSSKAGPDLGFTDRAFDEFRDRDGVWRRILTTGDATDYRLIIGLHGRAVVAIDDLRIAQSAPRTTAIPLEVGPPGTGWVPVPELSDEFNATTFDTAKWVPNGGGWLGRPPAFFDRRNVIQEGGMLNLQLARGDYVNDPVLNHLPKEYHTWTSATVHSTAQEKYGFFEIRAKPVAATASSAFWFTSTENGTEIDVFEIGGTSPAFDHTVHTTLHVWPAAWNNRAPHWAHNSTWDLPERPVDGFHIYSLQWDEQVIVARIDGAEVARFANTSWHYAMPVIFDIETMPDWFGLPRDTDVLPARFQIDWIRTWRQGKKP